MIIHEMPRNQEPTWNARLYLLVIAAMNNQKVFHVDSLRLFLEHVSQAHGILIKAHFVRYRERF